VCGGEGWAGEPGAGVFDRQRELRPVCKQRNWDKGAFLRVPEPRQKGEVELTAKD